MNRPLSYVQQSSGERRRRELARIDDMTVKDSTVSGRHMVYGLGEVLFDVSFPISFAHRPVPTLTPELDEGQAVVTGSFPRAEGCVVSYATKGRVEGAFDGFFVGATIAVTVYGGDQAQRTWICYSFHGDALRNPVHDTELLGDVI